MNAVARAAERPSGARCTREGRRERCGRPKGAPSERRGWGGMRCGCGAVRGGTQRGSRRRLGGLAALLARSRCSLAVVLTAAAFVLDGWGFGGVHRGITNEAGSNTRSASLVSRRFCLLTLAGETHGVRRTPRRTRRGTRSVRRWEYERVDRPPIGRPRSGPSPGPSRRRRVATPMRGT